MMTLQTIKTQTKHWTDIIDDKDGLGRGAFTKETPQR